MSYIDVVDEVSDYLLDSPLYDENLIDGNLSEEQFNENGIDDYTVGRLQDLISFLDGTMTDVIRVLDAYNRATGNSDTTIKDMLALLDYYHNKNFPHDIK